MTGIVDIEAIDLLEEAKQLTSPRRPHDMVFVGDSLLRLVLCEGEGKWYIHDYDEFFLHYSGGVVVIESDESTIELVPGTGVLVRRGSGTGRTARSLRYSLYSGTGRPLACWRRPRGGVPEYDQAMRWPMPCQPGGGEKVVVQTAESDAYQLQHIHKLILSYFCLPQNAAQLTDLQLAVKRNYTPNCTFRGLFFEYYVTFHAV